MANIFQAEDVRRLLRNKFVVILGDSIQRGNYKDFVRILQTSQLLEEQHLRRKGEESHCNDTVLEGSQLTNAKSYREVRQYVTDSHLVRFYFLTRCFGRYFQSILMDLLAGPEPDLIIMNSTLWDITRYGETGTNEYRYQMQRAFHCLTKLMPPHTLMLWLTALPVSNEMKGGFLLPDIAFMKDTLRLDVLEANFLARQVVQEYGCDVMDMHYFFRNRTDMRVGDGVHWNAEAHRKMTNFILAHVSKAWGVKLPGRDRRRNMFGSMDRGRQIIESMTDISASGPLPWEVDPDLKKKQMEAKKKREAEEERKRKEREVSFSSSDIADLDLNINIPMKKEEKKEPKRATSFTDLISLDDIQIASPPKKTEEKATKKDSKKDFSFDLAMELGQKKEVSQKKKAEKTEKKESTPFSFDIDAELSKGSKDDKTKRAMSSGDLDLDDFDMPPAKKTKTDEKKKAVDLNMDDLFDLDKEMAAKKEKKEAKKPVEIDLGLDDLELSIKKEKKEEKKPIDFDLGLDDLEFSIKKEKKEAKKPVAFDLDLDDLELSIKKDPKKDDKKKVDSSALFDIDKELDFGSFG